MELLAVLTYQHAEREGAELVTGQAQNDRREVV
jgi:hypothetical protein